MLPKELKKICTKLSFKNFGSVTNYCPMTEKQLDIFWSVKKDSTLFNVIEIFKFRELVDHKKLEESGCLDYVDSVINHLDEGMMFKDFLNYSNELRVFTEMLDFGSTDKSYVKYLSRLQQAILDYKFYLHYYKAYLEYCRIKDDKYALFRYVDGCEDIEFTNGVITFLRSEYPHIFHSFYDLRDVVLFLNKKVQIISGFDCESKSICVLNSGLKSLKDDKQKAVIQFLKELFEEISVSYVDDE